jgi:tripartite-type tricarboxylate transporter receptor subunit TctC
MPKLLLKLALALFAATLCAIAPAITPAQAQSDYPNRPIRLIVPFAPGGSTDAQARIIAEHLGRELGQQIAVVNVGGAGGTVGFAQAAKAAPDGYTLVTATPSLTINPYIQKDMPYDAATDFEPIVLLADSPIVLVVPKDSAIASVKDLIAAAKAKPGELRYGSAGVGSITHLSTARFASMAGLELIHVPYHGAAPAILDLIAGRLDLQFENAPTILDRVKSGELKGIAVGTGKPSAILPDLPTIAATVPGYEASSWFGLLAPAKTPRAIVDKVNAAANKVLADPALKKQMETLGVDLIGGSPDAFRSYLNARLAEMKDVSKAANLVPQ